MQDFYHQQYPSATWVLLSTTRILLYVTRFPEGACNRRGFNKQGSMDTTELQTTLWQTPVEPRPKLRIYKDPHRIPISSPSGFLTMAGRNMKDCLAFSVSANSEVLIGVPIIMQDFPAPWPYVELGPSGEGKRRLPAFVHLVRTKFPQDVCACKLPRRSKFPIFEISDPKNHQGYGFLDQKPQILGAWTPWVGDFMLLFRRATHQKPRRWRVASGKRPMRDARHELFLC